MIALPCLELVSGLSLKQPPLHIIEEELSYGFYKGSDRHLYKDMV